MHVAQELVSVLADPSTGEVHVVLAGWRISLNADEAALVTQGLLAGLDRLKAAARAEPAAPGAPWAVGRAGDPPSAAADSEAMQVRTRALIQASIREKGLSLREEPRE